MKGLRYVFATNWATARLRRGVLLVFFLTCFVDTAFMHASVGCDQLVSQIANLSTYGGIVDVSSYGTSSCDQTVDVNKPITIFFGASRWTFNGNPGIKIDAPKVTFECSQASEGDIYALLSANLMSGGPYPLVADTVESDHGTDGFTIRNCYLEGNGIGTFGLFFPYGNSGQIYETVTRGFTSAGQLIIGGQWVAYGNSSAGNGGDGVVWAYDGEIDGNPQYVNNGGSGIHVVVGGSALKTVATYHNALHGFYFDGRAVGDWAGQQQIISPSFIIPTTDNAGNYVFYTQFTGTTGTVKPSFCQSPGCTFADGTVTWINVGTALGYGLHSIFNTGFYFSTIESPQCSDTGFGEPQGFVADNIRLEGAPWAPIMFTSINGPKCHQSEGDDYDANGIHLINAQYTTIDSYGWFGSGYSNNVGGVGLFLESATGTVLSGMASYMSYSNAVKLVNSSDSMLSGIIAVDTGLQSTPVDETYAVYIDSNSTENTINGLGVHDDRTPPYSRGVYDAGARTQLSNYQETGIAGLQSHQAEHGHRPMQKMRSSQGTGRPPITRSEHIPGSPNALDATASVSQDARSGKDSNASPAVQVVPVEPRRTDDQSVCTSGARETLPASGTGSGQDDAATTPGCNDDARHVRGE